MEQENKRVCSCCGENQSIENFSFRGEVDKEGNPKRRNICRTCTHDPEAGFCYPAMYFLDARTALISYCAGGVEPTDEMCLSRTVISRVDL